MISRSLLRRLHNSKKHLEPSQLDLYRTSPCPSQVSHSEKSSLKLQSTPQKPYLDLFKSAYLYMDSSSTTKLHNEDIRLKAHKLCATHLGGIWSTVPVAELSVVPVSGGMSNFLYCCSLPAHLSVPDSIPSKVLIRLYGSMMPDCDIATQLEILNQLSLKNLGPKIYGSFEGGRLEEFLPANSLTSDELVDSEISSIIARKLAAIHDLNLDLAVNLDNTWALDRLCQWSKLVMEEDYTGITSANNNDRSPPVRSIASELLAIDYKKEIEFLKSILRNINSPRVFSHNDLHQGNILLATHSEQRTTLEERIIIIDFEYSSYNYRAFDIANHFTEWCFEYDTKEFPHFGFDKSRFPNLDTQRRFASHYLDQVNKLKATKANQTSNGCITVKQQGDQPSQANVEVLVNEVQPFLMVSNLMWTLWCIRSAKSSDIKFGYWEHAKARWQLYSEFKLNYIKAIQ